jgi:hypothetical protein
LLSNTKLKQLPAAVHKMDLDELDYSETPYEKDSSKSTLSDTENADDEEEDNTQEKGENAGCFNSLIFLIIATAGIFYFIFS